MAEVIDRDGLQNRLEGVGLVLSCSTGESVEALETLVELHCLEAVSPLAFLDGVLCLAFRTRRVLRLCGGVVHG